MQEFKRERELNHHIGSQLEEVKLELKRDFGSELKHELAQELELTRQEFKKNCASTTQVGLGLEDEDEKVEFEKNELQAKRYHTSKSGDVKISLREYVERMQEGRKRIYYRTEQCLSMDENAFV